MAKDWTGNKVSYITTNGFANNRDYDREAKESWPELDSQYEEIRERYMENHFDDDDW